MFKQISLVTFMLLIAMSATACGQLQLPTSLPQLPTDTQPSVSSAPAPNTQSDQSAQTTPDSGPQAGQNGNGAKAGKREAALLQLLERAGWDAGVITKISSDQITLRTIERPGLPNNPGQNQPGTNQPNPNQPNQNQPGQKRKVNVETVNVNSSTVVVVPGKPAATLRDLHVADRILTDVPQGKTVAALVLSLPKDFDKNDVVAGLVTGNSNGAITVRAPGGGDTVSTTATTQVFKLARDGVTPGSVSDLTNGNLVIALGVGTADTFTAQSIFALPKGAIDLGKRLGGGKKNAPPAQPPPANSGG